MNLLKIGEIGTRLDALERAHKTGEDPDPTGGLDGGLLGEPRLRPPSCVWRNSKGPSRPTKLVLRWLDEAHAFGDLESYVRWLLDRGSLRGRSRSDVDAAVRTAVGETVVRFELVLRINTLAHETIEREALVHAILAGRLALPGAEHGLADRGVRVSMRPTSRSAAGSSGSAPGSSGRRRRPGRRPKPARGDRKPGFDHAAAP